DRIEGIVITFTDITELKRAAEATRRLAAVLQGSSDAILVHDVNGRIRAWNRGAESIYGYKEAEALDANMTLLLEQGSRDGYQKCVERVLAGEDVQGFESRRRRKDGTEIEVSTT